MERFPKVWSICPADSDLSHKLSQELGMSPVVAQVLINRGIVDAAAAERFLHDGEGLGDPWMMSGMEKSVCRLKNAIALQEKITIYGDYDVDGITAVAVVYHVLKDIGADVNYYVPERQSEGYGLNDAALEELCRSGTKVVVTVDCGIGAVAEVGNMAGRLDIIITDHHQPPEVLPCAYSIINPKQHGCLYPEKQLAGVGVAFKLCQALWQGLAMSRPFPGHLDLVAIGTIADIVPLTGENRILVKQGLAALAATDNPGVKALVEVSGLAGASIDSGKVGYILAPRLNAAGRISHAAAGVELLITGDAAKATALALELDGENASRQAMEKQLLVQAENLLADIDPGAQRVLVLAHEDWHPGVIGIVASRLVDKYYRPVVMISVRDGIGKGSCRSIPGFDIYRALVQCSDLLVQFGGHQQAAGLTVRAEHIDSLRSRLNSVAEAEMTDADYVSVLHIDCKVALNEIDVAFVEELTCLAPYGMGNPVPVFVCDDLAITGVRPLGQAGRHFKIGVKQKGAARNVMAWNMADMVDELKSGDSIDLAFVPEINDWQGQRSIQLRARDFHQREIVPACLTLTDARNTIDKIGYLIQLIENEKQVLVYVNDRRQALKVAFSLRRLLPRFAREIAYYYSAQAERRGTLSLDAWEAGNLRVLISSEPFGGLKRFPEHVVLYEPPLSRGIFACHCRQIAEWRQPAAFHWLYGQADILQADELVAWYPERIGVGGIYLVLKKVAAANRQMLKSDLFLARKALRTFSVPMNEAGAGAALEVLRELGLVTFGYGSSQRVLCLNCEPEEKLAIDQSAMYRECVRSRKEFTGWMRELFQASVLELWQQGLNS